MRRFALADFVGIWSVARTITDHKGGPDGRFMGTARFAPERGGLTYRETGELQLGPHPAFKAERAYHWQQDGDRITIAFADGRPFHSFEPSEPSATHWCDPDTYEVIYDFTDWPTWRSIWTVSGPRKAYEMSTVYARIDD